MANQKRQEPFVLISAILASSMAFIDGTALNVAMPALQRSLDLDASELLWVVNSYNLFLAALILLGGSLGDIYGKKKVFLLGITLFTVFSALCGFSPNGQFLIVARALQGIGGALMVPGSLSLITATFPSETRGKAIGTWSMFSAMTTIFGPVLGGYLAELGLWRYIFFINIPLGIVSAYMLMARVEETTIVKGGKIDWWGATLATMGLFALTFGFLEASRVGFGGFLIWGSIILGTVSIVLFIWVESKVSQPMMPLALFRSSTFSGSNALTLFVYGALGAVLFFVPLNLIQIQGYPEDMAGFALLPFGGLIAILARVSGSWTDKVGAKLPLIIGPILTGLSFLLFTFIGLTDGPSDFWTSFFPALLLGGIGMGLTVVPLTTAVMNCVTEQNAGIASGVNNSVARLASVLTLATIGSFSIIYFQSDLGNRMDSLELSVEQEIYMEAEALKMGDAKADSSWPEDLSAAVNKGVKESFLSTFDIIAYLSALLCVLGALISWLYIQGKPEKIVLKS